MVDISINVGGNHANPEQPAYNYPPLVAQNPVFPLLPQGATTNSFIQSKATVPQAASLNIAINPLQQQPRYVPLEAADTSLADQDEGVELSKAYDHTVNSSAKLRRSKHLDGRLERQDDGRNRMNIMMSTLANQGADDVAKIATYWPINASSMFDKVANQRENVDEDALTEYAEKHPVFAEEDLHTLFDTTFDIDGDGTTTRDEFAQVSETGKALAGKKRRPHKPAYFD
jgi:hypothetical protein